VGAFDLANFWGVAMCMHDPLQAFLSAASTVKPGGALECTFSAFSKTILLSSGAPK